jgi:hypothetical protein
MGEMKYKYRAGERQSPLPYLVEVDACLFCRWVIETVVVIFFPVVYDGEDELSERKVNANKTMTTNDLSRLHSLARHLQSDWTLLMKRRQRGSWRFLNANRAAAMQLHICYREMVWISIRLWQMVWQQRRRTPTSSKTYACFLSPRFQVRYSRQATPSQMLGNTDNAMR